MGDLEDNLAAFEKELPILLNENEGRFAVGKAGDKFTCWDTYGDAIQYGYEIYGLSPFLVKEVVRFERPIFIGLIAA